MTQHKIFGKSYCSTVYCVALYCIVFYCIVFPPNKKCVNFDSDESNAQEQLQKRRRKQKNQGVEMIKENYRQSMDDKDNEIKQKLMEVHAQSAS